MKACASAARAAAATSSSEAPVRPYLMLSAIVPGKSKASWVSRVTL